MNKRVKQILTILLVAIILIGTINISSFAVIGESEKGKIVISEIEPDVKVSVYKLTNVQYDFDNANGGNGPIEPPYEWVEEVKTYLETKATPEYRGYVDTETFQKNIKKDSPEAAKFYDVLASAIRSGVIQLEATKTEETKGKAGGAPTQDVTISELEMGTYLVLIENGYRVYRPSVINLTPEFDEAESTWKMSTPAQVVMKSSEIGIQKEVKDENVSTTDKITYTLTADVPQYPDNSLAKEYGISDVFPNGLTYLGNVKVYGVGGAGHSEPVLLTAPQDYTLNDTNAKRLSKAGESTTFTIDFEYERIEGYEKVKVEYDARLKQSPDVNLSTAANTNKAYLDYSNNPYDQTSWNSKEATEEVFTYEIEITKKDKNGGALLSGAKFTLSTDGKNPIEFVKSSDGVYYKSDASTKEGVNELVTALDVGSETGGNKGKLSIRGLDIGKYHLTEVKAPDGYNKLGNNLEITILAGDSMKQVEVENNKGFVLPLTGGAGTVIFRVLGTTLFAIGLLLGAIIIYRKIKLNKNV